MRRKNKSKITRKGGMLVKSEGYREIKGGELEKDELKKKNERLIL